MNADALGGVTVAHYQVFVARNQAFLPVCG
jgi:hypothetical protein